MIIDGSYLYVYKDGKDILRRKEPKNEAQGWKSQPRDG
jgi:hypothetical protein